MTDAQSGGGRRLGDFDEQGLLDLILPLLQAPRSDCSGQAVTVGVGDDAAVLRTPGDQVLTTDTMVLGRDWLDEWSSGEDVGVKIVGQNLADIAAMGARPRAVLLTVVAHDAVELDWLLGLARGVGDACAQAGVVVVGGDLSSCPAPGRIVSVTAIGSMEGRDPVRRSGASVGDVCAIGGSLGLAAAGLELLRRGVPGSVCGIGADAIAWQRRPQPQVGLGPAAADAGASAMLDVSDGLLRDAARIADAAGVRINLHSASLAPFIGRLAEVLDPVTARDCVLSGGEEHSLLATFPAGALLPAGFVVIGDVGQGAGVTLDGAPVPVGGWDHFRR